MQSSIQKPWRVVLIEDNADTRLFFASCIARHSGLDLVGSFEALSPALAWFAQNDADLLVTDLELPDGSGITALKEVAARHPACDMVVISMFGDADQVVACIEAGAVGYVLKDSSADDIARVLLDVKRGASPISPMVARGLLTRLKQTKDQPSTSRSPSLPDSKLLLTSRETEILEMLARGYAYAEIAKLNAISLHTVQGHVKNIYGKLAVRSRGEAVFEASRMGLLRTMGKPV